VTPTFREQKLLTS